eukprot:comp21616_c0_seq1/m.47668 comp21616_c0_seq1/g.47668  ORF comp21616_c0_seq1/g.47668 comp21616_c0_seq1/m.47668 type:complete len:404 (-) comp21616_c0_seq1:146-1357(-)
MLLRDSEMPSMLCFLRSFSAAFTISSPMKLRSWRSLAWKRRPRANSSSDWSLRRSASSFSSSSLRRSWLAFSMSRLPRMSSRTSLRNARAERSRAVSAAFVLDASCKAFARSTSFSRFARDSACRSAFSFCASLSASFLLRCSSVFASFFSVLLVLRSCFCSVLASSLRCLSRCAFPLNLSARFRSMSAICLSACACAPSLLAASRSSWALSFIFAPCAASFWLRCFISAARLAASASRFWSASARALLRLASASSCFCSRSRRCRSRFSRARSRAAARSCSIFPCSLLLSTRSLPSSWAMSPFSFLISRRSAFMRESRSRSFMRFSLIFSWSAPSRCAYLRSLSAHMPWALPFCDASAGLLPGVPLCSSRSRASYRAILLCDRRSSFCSCASSARVDRIDRS